MHKLLWFVAIVIVGVFAALVIFNQNNPSQAEDLSLSISPTDAISQPIATDSSSLLATQSANPTAVLGEDTTNATKATIQTSKGNIEIEFYDKEAPKTVNNFVNKAQSGFYTNLTFHRVEDWVMQGGDPAGNGTGGGNMPVEFNNKPFIVGSVGVTSRGDGKVQNDAQFFITKKDSSHLNGQYTNFGMVTKGMDIVNKIAIGDKILGISVE